MDKRIIKSIVCNILLIVGLLTSQAASSSQATSSKASSSKQAEMADLFISIPLSGKSFGQLRQQIVKARGKIAQAAEDNGYQFDFFVKPEDFHITVERIKDIKVSDIPKYKACIQKAVDSVEAFDLREYVLNSYFDVWCYQRLWAVLRFDTPKKTELNRLVRQLKHCFSQAGLKSGHYNEYRAHISLGTLKRESASNVSDTSWAPAVSIYKGGHSLVVKSIDAAIALHEKDKKYLKTFKLRKQEKREFKRDNEQHSSDSSLGCIVM